MNTRCHAAMRHRSYPAGPHLQPRPPPQVHIVAARSTAPSIAGRLSPLPPHATIAVGAGAHEGWRHASTEQAAQGRRQQRPPSSSLLMLQPQKGVAATRRMRVPVTETKNMPRCTRPPRGVEHTTPPHASYIPPAFLDGCLGRMGASCRDHMLSVQWSRNLTSAKPFLESSWLA
jgi:hypothetical protein